MTILISHKTALDFWRWHAVTGSNLEQPQPARLRFATANAPSPNEVRAVCAHFSSPGEILHVLVAGKNQSRRSNDISYHAFGSPLPIGSFYRLSEEVFVASPLLAFVQEARTTPRVKLIQLGYELCGTYAVFAEEPASRNLVEPLATKASLDSFVARAKRIRGADAAQWALKYVLERSASPRETDVAMLLTLPMSMGGYGIEQPRLNESLHLSRNRQIELCRQKIIVDMYWEKANFALEYDSDEWHSGKEKLAADSRRRNDLRSLGLDTITVTNSEVLDVRRMDRIANSVAKKLGKRLQVRCREYPALKSELRRQIFGSDNRMQS